MSKRTLLVLSRCGAQSSVNPGGHKLESTAWMKVGGKRGGMCWPEAAPGEGKPFLGPGLGAWACIAAHCEPGTVENRRVSNAGSTPVCPMLYCMSQVGGGGFMVRVTLTLTGMRWGKQEPQPSAAIAQVPPRRPGPTEPASRHIHPASQGCVTRKKCQERPCCGLWKANMRQCQ